MGRIAVEIGDQGVGVAYGTRRGKILRAAWYPAQVRNGRVADGALREILTDFAGRQGVRGKRVSMTAKSTDCVLKPAQLPPMTLGEARRAALHSMTRYIPESLMARYVLEYRVLRPEGPFRRGPAEVMYMGLPLDLAEGCAEAVEAAGLALERLALYQDCVAYSLARVTDTATFGVFSLYGGAPEGVLVFLLVTEGAVRQFYKFAWDAPAVCLAEIEDYLRYRGLALETVYILDGPEWLAEYFSALGGRVLLTETGQAILKTLLRSG
jgi:hypothetical protein